MQIAASAEQFRNAHSSICDSFDPVSKVTAARDRHFQKQEAPIPSTEEGIQIDAKLARARNASHPISESLESLSKITLEMALQAAKLPGANLSTFRGIVTSPPGLNQKYNWIEMPSKSIKKSPLTLKWQLPSATEICRRFAPQNGQPSNGWSRGGRTIDERDGHVTNAYPEINESFEPGSNARLEIGPPPMKL
jgi:hypothetical protein